MRTGTAGSGSTIAAFLLALCVCCAAMPDLSPRASWVRPPPRPEVPRASGSLGSASPTGLFVSNSLGVTFPSPSGYSTIRYYLFQWNITLNDNLMNNVISIAAVNGSGSTLKMSPLYLNASVGFTRDQKMTIASDNNGANVYQQPGPWEEGAALALFLASKIEGIWPFSVHYTDSTQQYIDQFTIGFSGAESFASLSNTVVFSCVGTCTPPALP